jgi:metal-responsive CopG/Arc/MetJ family transcriptional regulator
MRDGMAVYKKMTITLHPNEIEKLDRIREKNHETKSGMIARLIQEYNE